MRPGMLIMILFLVREEPAVGQTFRAHVTGAVAATRVQPVPGGNAATQLRVEQAMFRLTATSPNGWWQAWASGNLEGLTLPDGALSLGAFGEGFIDRRHPHTYVHELGGSAVFSVIGGRASLSAGRGFVAFGTDDPMHQPAFAYPVNHHWSQILERLVLIGGFNRGPVAMEVTLFNGDEPERPAQWPSLDRFGDSWAVRLTLEPVSALEAQVSYADVRSPEHRGGAGPDARKWSASLTRAAPLRAHAEWALTDEGTRRFTSVLLTGEWSHEAQRPYARIERTDRPEEERTFDPFRTVRPHVDDHLLGITRWSVVTVGYGYRLRVGVVTLEPLVELAQAWVTETTGGLFDPALTYGRTTLRSLAVAFRAHWGAAGTMGRYGVRHPEPQGHIH